MNGRIAVALVVGILFQWGACFGQTTRPATGGANELMRAKSEMAGQGAEKFRLVNQKDEIVSSLVNGMTVITKRVASPVMAVRGYVYTGGIYEGKWLGGGLSHLLEHLVAGGSSERRTEAENRNLLQKIGNNSNAYTSADHTAYYINTTPEHMEEAVDLLTGWMLGALITPEEYRREYQVVQRELEKGKGEPGRQFYYMTSMNRFQVSPARVPVIGYQEVIQGLSRDDVYSYYKLTYQPNNMVFAVCGDLDPEVMLKAVQKFVSDAKPGRVFERDIAEEPPVVAPRTVVATFPKLGQASLELGFPTIKLQHPDLYALDTLATILGQGESSILTEELRDKRQLVRGIGASSWTPNYVEGTFSFDMQLDPAKIAEATAAVMEIVERIKKEGVDEERLSRAKTQMKVNRVRSLLTSEAIASSLAGDFMSCGDPHFSDRYVGRVAEVTAAQVKAVAQKYFDPQKLITTAMLPREYVGAGGLPKAEDLIRPVAPTTKPGADADKVASDVKRIELGNGTIVLIKRISTAPLAVMQMYALGGLADEDDKTNGLGNITMEMLPRGTEKRSAQQIALFFDSIGAELGTSCGNNSWYWTASCLRDNFKETFEVYADVVNNPSFPTDEIGPMKQRLVAAIEGQDAEWRSQAFRFFKKNYFGPTQSPYRFVTIGTKENVESFTAEQMKQWYGTKVKTARRVLAIYGDVDVDQSAKLAEQYFGSGEKLREVKLVNKAPDEKANDGKPAVDVKRVEMQETQQPLAGVVIGFDSKSVIGDEDNFPISVGDTMASGYTYPTGYLHEILRGRGLVYEVHAMNSPGRSQDLPGTFIAYAGCDPAKVTEVVETILENIARLQGSDADVNADWFDRSKKLITTNEALDKETPQEQAAQAALDELYGLGYQYHDMFEKKIDGVTLDRVREMARRRLNSCVVTISTPAPDKVQVKTGVRTYDKFPEVDLTPRGVQHDTGGGGK